MLIIITTALLVFPLALDLVSENNPKLCERCFLKKKNKMALRQINKGPRNYSTFVGAIEQLTTETNKHFFR